MRIFRQNQIELLQVIRAQLCRLAPIAELQRAQANPRFLAVADRSGESRRLLTGLPRASGVAQFSQCITEPELCHRQLRIQPERLMERSGRFDPHIGMKIGQPLVVIRLGIFGDRCHVFVRLADPVAKRQRAVPESLPVHVIRARRRLRQCGDYEHQEDSVTKRSANHDDLPG